MDEVTGTRPRLLVRLRDPLDGRARAKFTVLGPLVRAELVAATRSKGARTARMVGGLLLLGLLWYQYEASRRITTSGTLSASQTAAMALRTAEAILLLQGVATLFLVPIMVSGAVADHRRRGTLPSILAAPLTATEIILGLLSARLARTLDFLAVGLPVLLLLGLFGVDPGLTVAAYLGTASTASLLAAFSVTVAVHARTPSAAVATSLAAMSVWLVIPWVIAITPGHPVLGPWIKWANEAVYPTTPLYVLSPQDLYLWLTDGGPLLPSYPSLAVMVGMQAAWGLALLILAAARLRPASRALGDGTPRQRPRRARRPRCGDDPMWWKERHGIGTPGLARLTALPVLAFVWLRWRSGYDALFLHNYGRALDSLFSTGHHFYFLAWDPWGVENLVGRDLCWYGSALCSSWLVAVAAAAAAGVTTERESGTWNPLLATPLEPGTIVRAKVRGAARAPGAFVYLALLPWAIGLVINALQPIGVLAALLALCVFARFVAELGTFVSLRSRSTPEALGWTVGAIVALNLASVAVFFPGELLSKVPPLWLVGCMPVLLDQLPMVPTLAVVVEGRSYYLYNWGTLSPGAVSVLGYALGAWALRRASVGGFDAVAGRPSRVETRAAFRPLGPRARP